MFASMLGFFLTSLIVFFLLLWVYYGINFIYPTARSSALMDKSILHLKLDYPIDDRASNDPFSANFDFEAFRSTPGLNEILKTLKRPKSDEKIKGIFLDFMDVPSGLATISEIRNAFN